jgi:citrate lyase subunit beta/citryl-CoA lyase
MIPRCVYLYVPGNSPALIQAAMVAGADVIVLDLEDAVAPGEKDAARHLACEAIKSLPWEEQEVAVRINSPDSSAGLLDIAAVVSAGARLLRIPKVDLPEQLLDLDRMLDRVEAKHHIEPGAVRVLVSVESARGLLYAGQIAFASRRLDGLSIGGEDLTADFGAARSREGDELAYARTAVVCAARAAGIEAIDTVFSHIDDDEGLFNDARRAARLGFDGKSVVSPRQIPIVRRAFCPDPDEIAHARRVVAAAERALRSGQGVISVGGRMVDAPVIKRAERVLALARLANGGNRYEWEA